MSEPTPPRLASWVLACVLSERDRDAVLGDLAEEYALRLPESTRAAALLWYWRQVYESIPAILRTSARRGRWLSTCGLAVAIYLAAGALEFSATAAISAWLAPFPRLFTIVSLAVGLVTLVLGGYVANTVRPRTANVLATIVAVVVMTLMIAVPASVPLWYQLAFLIGGPVAAFAGGALCRRTRSTV